jgi:hypothetical protein
MPAIKRQTMGAVASLHLGSAEKSASTPVRSLTLTFTGIVSDAHGGPTRVAGPREPAFMRGTRLANLRQVSLVSMEELDIIASRMGIKRLDPGWLVDLERLFILLVLIALFGLVVLDRFQCFRQELSAENRVRDRGRILSLPGRSIDRNPGNIPIRQNRSKIDSGTKRCGYFEYNSTVPSLGVLERSAR